MANFSQKQPRQFSPYIPEVDTQVYAQALAKKDQEYQAGTQKVESYRNSVAGLPVAFEHERKYLQGVTNQLTSQINDMAGADWSDQKLVNQVATQASTIYNDPNIQHAMANASAVRSGNSDMQADDKISKGKNDVNKLDWQNHLRNFSNTAKIGDSFDDKYFNYQDVVGEFEKYYKDKHPNTTVNVQYGGYHYAPDGVTILNKRDKSGNPIPDKQLSLSTWDAKISKWKELSPTDVHEDLETFVKLNPNYGKQLDLNGQYSNPELGPDQVINKSQQVYSSILNITNRELSNVNTKLGLLSADDPDRKDLEKRKTYLEDRVSTSKDMLSPETAAIQRQLLSTNPDMLTNFRKQTYLEDFYNGIAKRYAYQEQDNVDLKGSSPFEKQMKVQELSINTKFKEQELQIQKERLALAKEQQQFKEQATLAKQRKDNTPMNASEYGANTTNTHKDDWQSFNEQIQDKALYIKNQTDKYIFDTYGDMYPELFEGSIPKDATAKKTLDDMYNKKKQAYKNGGKDDTGTEIELNRIDRNHFNSIVNSEKLMNAMNNKVKEGEDAWKRHLTTLATNDEDVKGYMKEASHLTPGLANSVANASIVYDKLLHLYNSEGISEATSAKGDALAKQYGFNNFGEVERYVNNHPNVVSSYRKVEEKENSFKSNFIKANNYLINKQFIPWVNPKTNKTDETVLTQVVPLLHGETAKLVDTKHINSVGYVQDPGTGEYQMVLKDADGKEEVFPITKQEAASHGFIDLQTEDQLSQLLKINRNQTGSCSSTYDNKSPKRHTYSDALYLTNREFNGVPNEIKYHVVEQDGIYYLEFWAKNIGDKNDNGHILKDKSGNKIEAQSNSLTDIRNSLNNYEKSGTTKSYNSSTFDGGSEDDDLDNNTNRNNQ